MLNACGYDIHAGAMLKRLDIAAFAFLSAHGKQTLSMLVLLQTLISLFPPHSRINSKRLWGSCTLAYITWLAALSS
jgi:hypothetical protein